MARKIPIILDGLFLQKLIEARFPNGYEGLIANWDSSGEGLNHSTIYRWTRGQLPQTGKDLIHLASILDVDPFCLLTFDRGPKDGVIEHLLSWAQQNKWGRLKFFHEFFGRQAVWPPPDFAVKHFGHPWFERTFVHDAEIRKNLYALLLITGERPKFNLFPQTFHFAFRQTDRFAGQWLQYGFVVTHQSRVRLQHINGHAEEYDAGSFRPARITTYFGPSSAEFKIASLHPFSFKLDDPESSIGNTVCFPG